jgi:hypothetical protein
MNAKRAKLARRVVREYHPNASKETLYEVVPGSQRVKEWPVPIGTNPDGTPKRLKYLTATFRRTPDCFKSLVKKYQPFTQGAAR